MPGPPDALHTTLIERGFHTASAVRRPPRPKVLPAFVGGGAIPLHGGFTAVRNGQHGLMLGPPGSGDLAPEWAEAFPEPPTQLQEVWRFADGIGGIGDVRVPLVAPCLLPSGRVLPLSAAVRFGENDVLFQPAAWLWVIRTQEGGWCVNSMGQAAAWNMHTHQLGEAKSIRHMWTSLFARWRQGASA